MFTKKMMHSIAFATSILFSFAAAKVTLDESIIPSPLEKSITNVAKKLVPKLKKLPKKSLIEVFNSVVLSLMSFIITRDIQGNSEEEINALGEKIQEFEQNQAPEAKD